MPSKQFAHLQEASRQRLQALIPHDCPLRVERVELFGRGGFKAITLDDRDCQVGRFEVVAAYITGFVTAWQRAARHCSVCGLPLGAHASTCPHSTLLGSKRP
jgi:hypothetical protein